MDSAAAQAQLQELTSLYERNVYVVYNVAARTTLDPDAAARAARRAFLGQVQAIQEGRLPGDAARAAVIEAAEVGEAPDRQPVEQSLAGLNPLERAALALTAFGELTAGELPIALGVDARTATSLLSRCKAQLASDGVSDEYFKAAWIEPPEELWGEVYAELRDALSRPVDDQPTVVQPPPVPRRRWRSRRAVLAVALLAALTGGAAAWQGSSGSGGGAEQETFGDAFADESLDSTADADYGSPSSGGSAYSPGGEDYEELSPSELDKLRKEEIADLKRYSRRKTDKSLPRRERRRAARQADYLVDLARRRLRMAERREANLRRQLARERAARAREEARERDRSRSTPSTGSPSRPEPQPVEREPERPAQEDPPPSEEPAQEDPQAECLYDEQSGSYICPE